MTRVILSVAGMHCSHCVQTVTRALEGVDGVDDVAVFLAEGEAEVETSAAADPAALAAAVTAIGYPTTIKSV